MQALERRAALEQVQARADARDMRVDGHVAQTIGEQQHAGSGLAPDAGQRDEVVARLVQGRARKPVERELARGISLADLRPVV